MTSRAASEIRDTETIFNALAHAQRREILLVLRFRGGAMTAGDIAERFACSWPTTTRHLRILQRAGLVRMKKHGRERVYHLDLARLRVTVCRWLDWFNDPKPHGTR
ncbi:MAG TPA: metalloregulator ArsR/SmtB family transcription factor [Candidatus Binatus sp.]|nr:metalloregulator ArsR/SmtB family transcription factor [Candidatus Binatus sp.]